MGKCICEQTICSSPNFDDLGEYLYCHRLYKFENDKWTKIDREEFRKLYRIKLIERQNFKNWILE